MGANLLSFKRNSMKKQCRNCNFVFFEKERMRYFLKLGYHGKNYFGWQKQPEQISIQEVIERCLSTLLRAEIEVVGAGRTDTGVHAKEYVLHFDSKSLKNTADFLFRLNSFLPKDIAVYELIETIPEAHARFDAVLRTYEYKVIVGKNPFWNDLAYQVFKTPNMEKMNQAASYLIGNQDFQSFSRTGSDVKTYFCEIKEAFWIKEDDILTFRITANRFLRNMVRAITGTLLEVGYDKISVNSMPEIIERKNRAFAGPSVPARGLYLTKIEYPERMFINKIKESNKNH